MKSQKAIVFLTRSAIIASVYAVLTIICAPISYGAIQFRLSEALTILPFYFPEAIPGLFVGCIIANIFSTVSVWDILIGSSATLFAAIITYRLKIKWLAPLPPIIFNGLFVGFEISFFISNSKSFLYNFLFNSLSVGIGEAVVCYTIGMILIYILDKTNLLK